MRVEASTEMTDIQLGFARVKDLEFQIRKTNWSLYEIDNSLAKGILRLIGLPSNIFEQPSNTVPSAVSQRQFAISTQGMVGFTNYGTKGPCDRRVISSFEYHASPKEDITSSVTPRDEPFNEFVVGGSPPILFRTRTVLVKLEVFTNRYTACGDPHLWVNHSTVFSVSDLKLRSAQFMIER
jgi:hypothetical protein